MWCEINVKKKINISNYLEQLELTELVKSSTSAEINGYYVCDLLSWVMSHAKKDELWLTVQTHPNIIAIGRLLELGGIVIVEGASIPEQTIERAISEGVALYQTPKSAADFLEVIYEL